MRPLFPVLAALLLSACAGHGSSSIAGRSFGASGAIPLECGPYARALSGVQLYGDAASWWDQAAGHYVRVRQPTVGSVLVFEESGRLPHGHVAVVSNVVSSRQIFVTQANWVHREVTEDQPVLDVSSANDWSVVRVWWPPSNTMGVTDYPTYGFVRPEHPASHAQLLAASAHAAEIATGH
jgi:surface antigen